MNEVSAPRLAPAPAGFLITSKSLDMVASLLQENAAYNQVRSLLNAAENELFVPLLQETKPTEFTQQFEFFANRYFPIRLQTLICLASMIGLERFRREYFDKVPSLVISFTQDAELWGLDPLEVATAFEEYFNSAQQIIALAPALPLAPAEPMLRLLNSITEIDFGFTALGLVFERSLKSNNWALHETFKLTRRSLLVYEDAVKNLTSSLKAIHPGQEELAFDNAYNSAVVAISDHRPETDDPPASDMRNTFRRYDFVKS